MNFGKLFKKLDTVYPIKNLSSNKFSALTYKELKDIAKVLRAKNWHSENYTIMTAKELAHLVYITVKNH